MQRLEGLKDQKRKKLTINKARDPAKGSQENDPKQLTYFDNAISQSTQLQNSSDFIPTFSQNTSKSVCE